MTGARPIISRQALEGVGGMAGAIGRRAEEVFRMGSTNKGAATPRSSSPVWSHRGRARLTPAGGRLLGELSAGMREVPDMFVTARLLVADRDPGDCEPTAEVAHEALLTRW